jgi:single-stranded-DNA-specific exonuclease
MSQDQQQLQTSTLADSSVDAEQLDSWPDHVPRLVREWMGARGIGSFGEFEAFTSFSLKDLQDPFAIRDMDRAVERLLRAFHAKEKICLYADFDMDGTPGLALLIHGLQLCGFGSLLSFQPNRFEDGYGVHPEIVEEFIDHHQVSLFVTVDVGITAHKAVELAASKGVDFIVTDHHQVQESVPPALAVVNPNRPDCDAGLGHLAGTGVAFYLVLALRKRMNERGLLPKNFDPKILLDCFAIGTLSDMVPLVRENRALTQHGLIQLARTQRLGLQRLLQELKMGQKRLSSSDVAIQLSPKLNALGRMDASVQALDIFLAREVKEAERLIAATLEAQEKRRDIQKKGEEVLAGHFQTTGYDQPFVFAYSESFYKGVLGLLATKSVEWSQAPSFIGTIVGDKIIGSARAPNGHNALRALTAGASSLNQFGGHPQAAGFELNRDQAQNFEQALREHFAQVRVEPTDVTVDVVATLAELDLEFKNWYKRLEPYGVGFEPPAFRLHHLFVTSVRVLKEKHLKFSLQDMDGNKIDGLWFFADNIEENKLLQKHRVSVVAQPSINEYMGRETLQLMLKDLEVEY